MIPAEAVGAAKAALSLARSRGEHLSDIIRNALHDYIKHEGKK